MRLRLEFGRAFLAGVAIVALASCGETAEEGGSGNQTDDAVLPDADLTAATPTPTAAAPPQSCESTSYCSGPLVVRSDNLTLSRPRDNGIEVVGTLSFENRSGSDLRVAILDENLVLNTTKGIRAEQNSRYVSGLGLCRGEGSECFDAEPDTFRLIAPGDSPAKLNIQLAGSFAPSLAPMVSQIETGTLTLLAYTVAADGSRQLHRVSLSNAPITNQVAQ